MAAAKGARLIVTKGQRTIKVFTLEGDRKKVTYEVAGMNKILTGNVVVFRDTGGDILNKSPSAITLRSAATGAFTSWMRGSVPRLKPPTAKNGSDKMLSLPVQGGS